MDFFYVLAWVAFIMALIFLGVGMYAYDLRKDPTVDQKTKDWMLLFSITCDVAWVIWVWVSVEAILRIS